MGAFQFSRDTHDTVRHGASLHPYSSMLNKDEMVTVCVPSRLLEDTQCYRFPTSSLKRFFENALEICENKIPQI